MLRSKMKMIAGMALVLSIVLSTVFLAVPALAEVNGTANSDQEQEKLRTQYKDCDGDPLQTQNRERFRTQNSDCDGNCTRTQNGQRQRSNERAENRFCNSEKSMEQYRNQYGQKA